MKREIKIKLIVLIVAFVVTAVSTYVSMYYTEVQPVETTMDSATLPVVYMVTEGGKLINPAYGYISSINGADIFNGITPLDEKRCVNTAIRTFGENISEVSYKVREIGTGSLLEDTVIDVSEEYAGYVTGQLKIKNLIEKDKQYLLEIVVKTDKHDKITYYERILWQDNLSVDAKLDFTLQFNSYTYDQDNLSEIDQWIETDGTQDNTNYGIVNIHSSAQQIGFGDLKAVIEGDVTPVIIDISQSSAQIKLVYRAAVHGEGATYDTLNVRDYYRIRHVGEDKFYLIAYEREADQIFDGTEDLQASGRINLGIKSVHEECEAMSDDAGKYAYFEDSGQLWCYDRPANRFISVFSFQVSEGNTVRERNQSHGIKMLKVDDTGDSDFIVYGYMNRGEHEGTTGISIYHYSIIENEVNELLFIPLDMSYEYMSKNIGDIAYISQDQLYIRVGSILYSADLVSMELMTVTDGLFDGTYAVNADGTRLAYHMSHSENGESKIRVINFTDGTEHIIDAADYAIKSVDDSEAAGSVDRIRIIGYIDDDIVFGIYNTGDIAVPDGVNTIYPMYGIYILDADYEIVKTYYEQDIYTTEAYIDGMRVNLSRVMKNENGEYIPSSVDQLMNRKENNAKSGMYTETVATKAREKELYLYLPSTAGNTEKVTLRYAKRVVYSEGTVIELDDYIKENGYMAYGYGEFIGRYDSIVQAVKAASTKEGFVLNESGLTVWHRMQKTNNTVWNDMYANLMVQDMDMNLTGLSLSNILYFISDGKLVMARNGQDSYVIIYDYDNVNIYYYDQTTGKLSSMERETAQNMFIEWGNVFLTR